MKQLIYSIMILLFLNSCKISNKEFHFNSFVADTHNDVLLRSMIGEDILTELPDSQSDLVKFQKGGMDLEIFSVWVSPYEFKPEDSFEQANKMITHLENLCDQTGGKWSITRNYQEIIYNDQRGVLSCMIGVEGGHAIENKLINLDSLYSRGMRYLSITWNNSTDWATSAKDETLNKDSLAFIGLTGFGKEVIRRCNELGIMVDVSHSGEKTFWDIIHTTTKPIIASHSSAYYLCPHFRNLKDDQLIAIKEIGGVVFVNYYPSYIDSTFREKAKVIRESFQPQIDSLSALYDPDGDEYWYKENQMLLPALQKVAPSVDMIIDHIAYLSMVMGIDHVGLGADWDGVEVMPTGMEDVTNLPVITEKLLARGFSKSDVQKILGGNFKRVFREITN
ncbi:MAG: dipeptidase [Fidelibacterota bacterium]